MATPGMKGGPAVDQLTPRVPAPRPGPGRRRPHSLLLLGTCHAGGGRQTHPRGRRGPPLFSRIFGILSWRLRGEGQSGCALRGPPSLHPLPPHEVKPSSSTCLHGLKRVLRRFVLKRSPSAFPQPPVRSGPRPPRPCSLAICIRSGDAYPGLGNPRGHTEREGPEGPAPQGHEGGMSVSQSTKEVKKVRARYLQLTSRERNGGRGSARGASRASRTTPVPLSAELPASVPAV